MNIFFDCVGCRLNQSEIEKLATQIAGKGYRIVSNASQADIVVINTCAVTSAASSDSRQKIRQALTHCHARIIITGCYATLEPRQIFSDPTRIQVVPNSKKEQIANDLVQPPFEGLVHDANKSPRVTLPGKHKRTRAFIKVQEGCDNTCTFCVTRIARGRSRSQSVKEIYADIDAAVLGGANEIVLTGTNLGSWGRDFDNPSSLTHLISDIQKKYHEIRIRLSSLEPWDFDPTMIEVMEGPGFCRHLHLPIQSGCDAVLRLMDRPVSIAKYAHLLDTIRRRIPEIAITTDIMVGFPGEGDLEFKSSLEFIERMEFAGGHVFRFSPRPGTPASNFSNKVNVKISKERSQMMRNVLRISSDNYHRQFTGNTTRVLWERFRNSKNELKLLCGLTDNYMKVEAESAVDLQNSFSEVLLELWDGIQFKGRIIA